MLVEPNRIVRQGLRVELSRSGAEIVAEPATGAEAIAAAGEHGPDIVVLDLNLPDGSATEVCATLAREDPARPVIVLADPGDEAAVGAVVECGARAYLLKDAEDFDLADVISRVLAGESVIDPRAAAVLIDSRRSAEDAKLTAQELKVVRLAAEGLTNPEIGERLFVSRRTVETHVSHAFRKLGLSSRTQLAAEAARRAGSEDARRSPPGRE